MLYCTGQRTWRMSIRMLSGRCRRIHRNVLTLQTTGPPGWWIHRLGIPLDQHLQYRVSSVDLRKQHRASFLVHIKLKSIRKQFEDVQIPDSIPDTGS